MKILLLRHGETAGNREKRYVGRRTDEPLTEEAAAGFLLASKNGDSDFYRRLGTVSRIYTSPMKRCVETAKLIFPEERFPECGMIPVSDLTECDFGIFEYKNWQELCKNTEYQRFIDSGGLHGFAGGEQVGQFKARCAGAFLRILKEERKNGGRTLVFVVHGGTIMSVLEAFGRPRKDYFSWQTGNGCGYLCEAVMEEGQKDKSAGLPAGRTPEAGFCLTAIAEISVL